MANHAAGSFQRFANGWRISLPPHDSTWEVAGKALLHAFRKRGALGSWALPKCNPQQAVDADSLLAEDLFENSGQSSALHVWRNHPSIVVPRRFAQMEHFPDAVAMSPFPVTIRRSGGTTVVHGPHILNISLATISARSQPLNIPHAYARLGRIIISALDEIGVRAQMGNVDGSHCPGLYSIVAGGRKLAGTAAFVTSCHDARVVVAHANLNLAFKKSDIELIIHFERSLKLMPSYQWHVHAGLDSLVPFARGMGRPPRSLTPSNC